MDARTADLHAHTHFSDGTDTPERVIELAKQAGLSAIAITDHDNVQAHPVAAPAAARAGVELLMGIEMSASLRGAEVHLLGFLFDPAHPPLTQHLATQQARRVERAKEMVQRLNAAGVALETQDVFGLAGPGTIGRPHVARALVNRGHVGSSAEAFERYLSPGGVAFVPGSAVEPSLVIRLILEAGGVPVLAHPIYLKSDPMIDEMAAQGLAGLEVYHSSHNPETVRRYEAIADRLQLVKTGGSDYHGQAKEGQPIGAVKAPYALVEALRAWQAQRR